MNSNSQFDAIAYFKNLATSNKLAQEQGFFACTCSGIDGIGDILQQYQRKQNFIMIDDTTSQQTYSRGSGFFDKNVYTVFILATYRMDDMNDREEKLRMCRRLFRQFHSRMIHDKYEMIDSDCLAFLDVDAVYSKEFPVYSLPQMTGLYFMVNNDEPVDLTYDANEWGEEL